jgi:G3E family GTPase
MLTPTVTLLTTVDLLLREELVTRVRDERPDVLVLRYELGTRSVDGTVRRTTDGPDGSSDDGLPADDQCCLTCLVREDALAMLCDLTDGYVLLVLPPAIEPAGIALAIEGCGHAEMDAIAAAVEARHLEATLMGDTPLTDLQDIGDDRRSVAEVLARHLEHADVVVHSPADDRAGALLTALGPSADRVPAQGPTTAWLGTGSHDHGRLVRHLQAGVPRATDPIDTAGISHRSWHRRRPLHPDRLLDALDTGGLAGVVRVTGSLWVATRPGTIFELEVAGGSCELGAVDAWLTAVPVWDHAEPFRRRQAERRWHPYYGDRAQDLVLTCADRDPDAVLGLLDDCLLTDAELAEGEDAWTRWPDPFTDWLGDERELLESFVEEPGRD